MLRMPNPLRAFEPRMEIPTSRGPLPCLTEMPGLSSKTLPIEKARVSSNRSRLMAVMVCPGALRTPPGPGVSFEVAVAGAVRGAGAARTGAGRAGPRGTACCRGAVTTGSGSAVPDG